LSLTLSAKAQLELTATRLDAIRVPARAMAILIVPLHPVDLEMSGGSCSLPVILTRTSFGTQMIQRFDIYKIQRWLGHKSITTTEKYLHYKADPDTAAAMGDLWATSPAADVVPLRRAA
jgi:hypothetical protein